jgi:hypothetical protein
MERNVSQRPRRTWWTIALLFVAGLPLAACNSINAGIPAPSAEQSLSKGSVPAGRRNAIGDGFNRVTLTATAAEQFDVRTAPVRQVAVARAGSTSERLVIPYSAVVYDAHGDTWVYTNPEPLVFVRQRIAVDYIEGDTAVLANGPAPETLVVTTGADLLLSAESELGN